MSIQMKCTTKCTIGWLTFFIANKGLSQIRSMTSALMCIDQLKAAYDWICISTLLFWSPRSLQPLRKISKTFRVTGPVIWVSIWGANCLTSEMDPWLGRSAMLLAEGTLAIHARAFHSLSSFSSSSNKLRQALTLDVPFMKTSFAAQFSPKKIFRWLNRWPHKL